METYYSFNGSDHMLMLNGRTYGEVVSCKSDSMSKRIELDIVLFYNIPDMDAKLRKITGGNIVEIFSNEHRQNLYKRYSGVKYIGQRSNHSVDDMPITNIFIFEYESDIPLQPVEGSLREFIDNEKLKYLK